jgi:hypothetical protein
MDAGASEERMDGISAAGPFRHIRDGLQFKKATLRREKDGAEYEKCEAGIIAFSFLPPATHDEERNRLSIP